MMLDGERVLGHVLERCASDTGMLPGQVWDGPDLPARGLYRGRATGSASPLGWAHAEYVKLCRSLRDDRVFDRPRAPRVKQRMSGAGMRAA